MANGENGEAMGVVVVHVTVRWSDQDHVIDLNTEGRIALERHLN